MRITIGMSGASGLIYGIRLLEVLKTLPEVETHLVMTASARMNIAIETDWALADVQALADQVHPINDMAASIASGSWRMDGMIVAPCSMKSLSAIVHSHADNLLIRAADVTLKERRRLVLMLRETPLHAGHLRAMLEVTNMGAVVAPPLPAFYTRPQSLDDMVRQSVGRVLDLFDLEAEGVKRWGEEER